MPLSFPLVVINTWRPRNNGRQISWRHALYWMKICNFRLKYSSTGSDDGLAPNRWQAIIWNNGALVSWPQWINVLVFILGIILRSHYFLLSPVRTIEIDLFLQIGYNNQDLFIKFIINVSNNEFIWDYKGTQSNEINFALYQQMTTKCNQTRSYQFKPTLAVKSTLTRTVDQPRPKLWQSCARGERFRKIPK